MSIAHHQKHNGQTAIPNGGVCGGEGENDGKEKRGEEKGKQDKKTACSRPCSRTGNAIKVKTLLVDRDR